MQPLKLSDNELSAVLSAARPIAPHRRDAFLQAIADALAAQREVVSRLFRTFSMG